MLGLITDWITDTGTWPYNQGFRVGLNVCVFFAVVEVTGKKWRTAVGITVQSIFALGYMSLSAFGYVFHNWRQFQFAISLVPVPFLIIWWFIPESPR